MTAAGIAPDAQTPAMAIVPLAVTTTDADLPFHDDVTQSKNTAADRAETLAELVAAIRALPPVELNAEARCMAAAIYWEAKGEPLAGQLAVAQVIRNRVDSGRWADSVCGVVKQPRQFSFVRGGAWADPVERDAWATARALALIALSDSWRALAGGATSFHATRVSPGWQKARVATIGNHVFYR